MRLLAIDCATEACSVALFDSGELRDHRYEVIGRGHAERLVPMIAELPGKGRADRILVSLGPGSFTGVRIGLAAARALGLVWQAQVLGYPTLALVAAMARRDHPGEPVSVCMSGGHGEYFVQDFGTDGLPDTELASVPQGRLGGSGRHRVIAGSQAAPLAASYAETAAPVLLDLLPDARHALLVPAPLLSASLAPLYGRAPDARPPGVRP